MSEITIKKGSVVVTCKRSDLMEVSETHDGIVFKFKDGIDLYQIDHHMPVHVKQIMSNSAVSFDKGKLIFDLNNYQIPIKVDAT